MIICFQEFHFGKPSLPHGRKTAVCPECHGAKLNKEALSFRIHDKNIYELSTMDISELYDWLSAVDPHLSSKQQQIAGEILKEIRTRLKFLLDNEISAFRDIDIIES